MAGGTSSLRPAGVAGKVLAFGALAAVSAIASAYLTGAMVELGGLSLLPLPGIYFGLALAAAVRLWGGRATAAAGAVLAATLLAWLIAFECAIRVSELLGRVGWREIAGLDVQNAVAGFVAGALGAAVTYWGVQRTGPGLWSRGRLAWMGLLGGALGMLLDPAIEGDGSLLLVLFLPWQTAVAMLIGRWLARPLAPLP